MSEKIIAFGENLSCRYCTIKTKHVVMMSRKTQYYARGRREKGQGSFLGLGKDKELNLLLGKIIRF